MTTAIYRVSILVNVRGEFVPQWFDWINAPLPVAKRVADELTARGVPTVVNKIERVTNG